MTAPTKISHNKELVGESALSTNNSASSNTIKTHHTSGIFVECITRNQPEYLFLRRSQNKKFAPNKWNVPAGSVESGETKLDAAIRELREEAGIIVKSDDVVYVSEFLSTTNLGSIEFSVFFTSVAKKPMITVNSESSEFGWFTLTKAKRLDLIKDEDESIRRLELWKLKQ